MRRLCRTITSVSIMTLSAVSFGCSSTTSEEDPTTLEDSLECHGERDTNACVSTDDGYRVCGEDAGIPFVSAVLASYNEASGTTAAVSVEEEGTVCLSGTMVGQSPENFGAQLVLAVDSRADSGRRVVSTFDARALGLAGLRFRVVPTDTSRRISIFADVVTQCDCEAGPYYCVEGGSYSLATPDHTGPLRITEPTTITAWFDDFLPDELDEPLSDTTRLSNFHFDLSPTDVTSDYEFCVSEVEFLDGKGRTVQP